MTYAIFGGWYLCGVIGSTLLWLEDVTERSRFGCPTRKAILAGMLAAFLGAGLLIAAVVIWFIHWLDHSDLSWWSQPVCGKRKP